MNWNTHTRNRRTTAGFIAAGLSLMLVATGAYVHPAQSPHNVDLALATAENTPLTQTVALSQATSTTATDENFGIEPVETRNELSEVAAPDDYTSQPAAQVALVDEQQSELTPLSSEEKDGVGTLNDDRQRLSVIQQPVTSKSAIIGITVPAGEDPELLRFEYRTRHGNTWSEWTEVEAEDAHLENGQSPSVIGTEPVAIVDVDEVEAAVSSTDGRVVSGAELTVINPEGETMPDPLEITASESEDGAAPDPDTLNPAQTPGADRVLEQGGAAAGHHSSTSTALHAATGVNAQGTMYDTGQGFTITTRKGWGADESKMTWTPEALNVKGVVLHHTAGANNYTQSQVPGIIRSIYLYHAVTLGWGDIGYNILVDKYGGIWEGRSGGLTKGIMGAHAYGANGQTFGISVLGNYETAPATNEIIDSVARVMAWKLKLHGITNPNATIVVPGAKNTASLTIPVVSGHRDVGYTACPGKNLYAELPTIRQKIITINKSGSTPQPPKPSTENLPVWSAPQQIGVGWNNGQLLSAGAFSGRGHQDALLLRTDGTLHLYSSTTGKTFAMPRQIGHGWTFVDQVSAGVDFDGDGNPDIIARRKSNGDLLLYRGNGKGGFLSTQVIGNGWGIFSRIFAVNKYTDNNPALLGIERSTGRLRAYITTGRGRFLSPVVMGSGWDNMRSLNMIPDVTGDGVRDLTAINQAGRFLVYSGLNSGALGASKQVGQGWNSLPVVLTITDSSRMWAVSTNGKLYHYELR
ncbi:N-acetylmuramoyl-L-alanine amidase [Schaalia sp. ZJ1691]|uniref:N-acetylmuramoyl-L-alanine amidase n=1 Tax=Schaalia sp. ZJ1691 TaxID=2709404 RepID=UPI0013EE2B49|nr:N-acetylmuramoyl-L-alanine amidase [Schaalia sp. ZJ1691]